MLGSRLLSWLMLYEMKLDTVMSLQQIGLSDSGIIFIYFYYFKDIINVGNFHKDC